MNVALIKELGNRVKERKITWAEASRLYNEETGEHKSPDAFRSRYRHYTKKKDKTDIENENKEYTTQYNDGTIEAQKIIEYNKEVFGNQEKMLEYLGYNDSWEFVFITTSAWQQHTKEQNTKQLYAVKYKVKPKVKQELDLNQYIEVATEEFKKEIKPIKRKKEKQIVLDKNKLMELTGIELHLGKMAWSGETGQDYDKDIAQERFYTILDEVIHQQEMEQCDTCLLCIGNDFFNSDTVNATTTKGTPQQNDLRWKKMFNIGLEMYRTMLEELRTRFNNIEVRLQSGNHDKMASFYLYIALSCLYENDPKINFAKEYKDVQCFEWGKSAIAFTHGDSNLKRLIKSIPIEFREELARCPYFELHLGHLHKEVVVDDDSGIITRRVGSPTGTDAWHYEERFLGSTQKYQTFIWDKEKGLQNIKYINFENNKKKLVKE